MADHRKAPRRARLGSWIAGVAWCLAGAWLLLGCQAAESKPERVKIRAMVGFSTGTDNRQIEIHRQLAREFNAFHPGIELEFITVNQMESAETFRAMHEAGQTPELVLPIGVAAFAAWQEDWLDLAPLLAKRGELLPDFHEQVLKSLDWPATLKALPLGVYPSVLFYNADMFDRAKLDYPPHQFGGDPEWTYDALLDRAIRLTRDRSGKTPLDKGFDAQRIIQYGYDGTDWAPLLVWPTKFGGAPLGISGDGRTAQVNSEAWKESFRYLRDSIHTWFVRPVSGGNNASPVYGENDPLGSNTTAMWEAFSWIEYAWIGWNNNFRWDVAAIPAGPSGRVVSQANLELGAIPRNCAHPEEALEVLLWLAKPENQLRLSKSWGCVPILRSLGNHWIEEHRKLNPNVDWPVFIQSIEWMGIPNHEAWVPAYRQVHELYDRTLNAITTGQLVDTDQAAEDLNAQVQSALDAWWQAQAGQEGKAAADPAASQAP